MKKLSSFLYLALAVSLILTLTACISADADKVAGKATITVPASLSTVKLDAEGNDLGNVTFNMTGTIGDTKADIVFDRLDTYESYNMSTLEPNGVEGGLLKFDFAEYSFFALTAYQGNNASLFYVAFSPDGDYWLISNESENLYYYACVSGTATTEELIRYFSPLGLRN